MHKYYINKIVFIKYVVVNGVLTAAYFLLYYGLIECLKLYYLLSNIISYIITVTLAYYLTRIIVFKSNKDGFNIIIQFVATRVIMVVLNSGGLYVFTNIMDIDKYLSFVVVNIGCFLGSYVINKWIFTGQTEE